MAKKVTKSSAKAAAKVAADRHDEIRWPFGTKNYLVFALALVANVVGFVLLGQGDMTLSVFLLVVGYCVLLPIAIMIEDKPEESKSGPEGATPADLAK